MDAFKCDRCMEYKDGRPYGRVSFSKFNTLTDCELGAGSYEYCERCYTTVLMETKTPPHRQG